jgi:hypothetical protein
MAGLQDGAQAILELRKLEDYCLNPGHPRGRHKARVFRDALGIGRSDASWLRERCSRRAVTARRSKSPATVRDVAGASMCRSRDKKKVL